MLLNDIYYEAGEIEASALRKPSWAKPYTATTAARKRRGPRAILGHALMNLGRVIAAEPKTAARPARVR
ncbi:MAG: hypothetical protein QOJ81_1663 [Chloroflexota bacterium]|jgi:hypothetical protein|nr:hypothetical protein [Chloroflexota bacterium]